MSLSGWASVIASNTAPMFRSTERPFALEKSPVAVAAVPEAAPVEPAATATVEPVASAPSATVTLAEVSVVSSRVVFFKLNAFEIERKTFHVIISLVIDESLRPLQGFFCITS